VAALGRKNFLFVGTDHAGENLAGLYSLIATCEANNVNPAAYLADVLVRVQSLLLRGSTNCCRTTGRRCKRSRRPKRNAAHLSPRRFRG